VLILVVLGPLAARWTEPLAGRLTASRQAPAVPAGDLVAVDAVEPAGTAGGAEAVPANR